MMSAAIGAACHTYLPHCRPNCDGHMQRRVIVMRHRWLRDGVQVRCLSPHTYPLSFKVYARCHLGKVIRYDTVTQLGWGVDVRTHGIKVIVERLLASDWDGGDDDGKNSTHKEVPDFYDEEDCIVRNPHRRLGVQS